MIAAELLPSIPGPSCPPAASALAAAGLGPACAVVAGASGAVGSVASNLAGFGVSTVLDALGSWVAGGATWLLAQVGGALSGTTGIQLGSSWFTVHYETMAVLCGVVIVPLLLLGIVQSVYRQNASMLIRSTVVNVPLALLLTGVAVQLVQLGLAVTDAMSESVAGGAGLDTGHFMASVATALSGGAATGQPAVPAFVVFVGGVVVVVGAMLIWLELLMRAAAVYVAVLFLPLALASLAWPAISHWCRRLVDTLAALVLGKLVIVAVLSLAVGALAGGTGWRPASAAASGSGGGFGAVLAGAALLLLAAFAPWGLFRLLPFLEAGAVAHLEGLTQRARHSASAPVAGLAHVALRSTAAGAVAGAVSRAALGATGVMGKGGPGVEQAGGGEPTAGPTVTELSSAERSGVGTDRAPGSTIPRHRPNPAARALAETLDFGTRDPPEPRRAPQSRPTGRIERDGLGIRLVDVPRPGPATGEPAVGEPGPDAGRHGRG